MKRIMLIFGTRPEAIKMAPLAMAMAGRRADFECITCVTAQHRQMLDQALSLFGVRPTFDLNVMRQGQTLFDVTIDVLQGLQAVLRECRPDVVLVQGDTTTSLVGALAAFYERIKIGHVEAGLRTHEKYSPFPEEMNRQLVTRLADFHFAPTSANRANLLAENVPSSRILETGNTGIDALCWVRDRIYAEPAARSRLDNTLANAGVSLRDGRRRILVTGHRRESFGQGFLNICGALKRIAETFPSLEIVYPVHLNPSVQEPVRRILGGVPNIRLIAPMDYEPFVYMMNECYLVLTDSGGVQEEAPSLGKPVLVMRENTERPEAVEAGTVRIVGTEIDQIVASTSQLLNEPGQYARMAQAANPYGDGLASNRILDALVSSAFN